MYIRKVYAGTAVYQEIGNKPPLEGNTAPTDHLHILARQILNTSKDSKGLCSQNVQ